MCSFTRVAIVLIEPRKNFAEAKKIPDTGRTDGEKLTSFGIMEAKLRASETPGTITAIYRIVRFKEGHSIGPPLFQTVSQIANILSLETESSKI